MNTKEQQTKQSEQESTESSQFLEQKSLSRSISVWSAVIIIIGVTIFGMIYFVKSSKAPINNKSVSASLPLVSSNDWMTGNKKSKVTLIEYSDFQCPACGFYYPIVKKLSKEFNKNVLFIYRYFPLRQIHPNAQLSAQSAQAAGLQGKFWEMHDLMFENQGAWSGQESTQAEKTFVSYADKLGLNMEQFKKDINSKKVIDRVDNDYKGGVMAGVKYTPFFFLNGKNIVNPRSYEEFNSIIKKAISDNT